MQNHRELNILVVGGGGREHALCWKIAQSSLVVRVYCAPGNAGIAKTLKCECVPIKADDISALLNFAREREIDLTVVGPEGLLVQGIADEFQTMGLTVFGPSFAQAQLEGSKAYAKMIMGRYGIPTAPWEIYSGAETALKALDHWQEDLPVVKYDLLAAGKGVFIPSTREEAKEAIRRILVQKEFGDGRCLFEKRLRGFEVSVLAFVDGETVVLLPASQDHKRVGEDDTGPNTGGMGAYSPVPAFTPELKAQVLEKIMKPIAKAMVAEGSPYKGILYAGIMIVENEPYVLEFNVRFGDPETQPVLMRLQSDLIQIMLAVCEGRLSDLPPLLISPHPAVCIVLASQGYPDKYEKGFPIHFNNAGEIPGVVIFHAGTAEKNGQLVTDGGRVLGVTVLGRDMEHAIAKANLAADTIFCSKLFHRRDIGRKALLQII